MPSKNYVWDGAAWTSPFGTIGPGGGGLVTSGVLRDGTPIGLPTDAPLEPFNSPSATSIVIPPGTYNNKIFYGDAQWSGDVELNYCWVRGGSGILTGDKGCLNGNGSTGNLTANYCLIKPQREVNGRNCVLGKNYHLNQCHMMGGVDGFGFYSTSGAGTLANVDLFECLVEDLAYFYPDNITTSHTDGVHGDGGQGQGGDDNSIKRVDFRGTAHAGPGSGVNPDKPWLLTDGPWNNGAGLIIQNNTGAGFTVAGTIVEECWFAGGLAHLNVKPYVNFTFRNNLHYYDVAHHTSPTYSRYYLRFDQISTNNVPGITSSPSNRWVDGPNAGQLLTLANGGVYSNV